MFRRKYRNIYENYNDKKITYKVNFSDSYRFMSTSLSNLVDNISGVYDKECKKCMERKKISLNCEFCGFKNGRLNILLFQCCLKKNDNDKKIT